MDISVKDIKNNKIVSSDDKFTYIEWSAKNNSSLFDDAFLRMHTDLGSPDDFVSI